MGGNAWSTNGPRAQHGQGVHRTTVETLVVLILATTAFAQFDTPSPRNDPANVPYDGRFTFVRLRWRNDAGSRGKLGVNDMIYGLTH
jgi:hypothetical protein